MKIDVASQIRIGRRVVMLRILKNLLSDDVIIQPYKLTVQEMCKCFYVC